MHWEKSWNEACCQSEGELASPGEISRIPDSLPHHLTGKTGAKTMRDRTTPWPGSPSCVIPLTPCLNLYLMLGPLKKRGTDSGWGRSTDLFVPFPNVTTLNKSPPPLLTITCLFNWLIQDEWWSLVFFSRAPRAQTLTFNNPRDSMFIRFDLEIS